MAGVRGLAVQGEVQSVRRCRVLLWCSGVGKEERRHSSEQWRGTLAGTSKEAAV